MKSILFYTLLALTACMLLFSACKKDDDTNCPTIGTTCDDGDATTLNDVEDGACNCAGIAPPHRTWNFEPGATTEDVQEAMILMENGDTIKFAAGTFDFNATLSIDSKDSIVVCGAGKDQTTLSFAGQLAGAEGLYVTNCDWFLMQNLTVADAVGDNVKLKDGDGVTFLNVDAVYTGPVGPDNGAYALYPVTSRNVYLDNCYIRGASDAGIYVGQSEQVVVRNCFVEENVAGIEIENCINADVYNNEAYNNTGGILVFDLANLPVIPNGERCRVYDNLIRENAHANFAPGGTVADIPPGTGIMLLSSANVEVFGNDIINNNIMGIGIISMVTLDVLTNGNTTDPNYDLYTYSTYIHDNNIQRTTDYPADLNDMGGLLASLYSAGDIPDIVYDGVISPDLAGDTTEGICIQNNGSATFVDLNVLEGFANQRYDVTPHDCAGTVLEPVSINAPAYQ